MVNRAVGVFAALAAGKVVSMVCNMIAPVIIGRRLGPELLGRWTLLVAAGTLLHTVLVNWTHNATVRYGSEEWVQTRGLNRTLGSRLPLLGGSLIVAVLVLMLQPGRWTERWFGAASTDTGLIALVLAS